MKIHVDGKEIAIKSVNEHEYFSLTDMAKNFSESPRTAIEGWMKNNSTIRFLAIWEKLNNPDFNSLQMEGIRIELIDNGRYISVKRLIERTGAIGLQARAGRYGGTYAHVDIAFEFASWLSPEFKMYLITEFKRLKAEEQKRLNEGWDVRRFLAKINYGIQTEMINRNILPRLEKGEKQYVFANEADLLNVAVFGMTAKEYREQFPKEKGNLRDHATIQQLTVLSNLESINAHLIESGASQEARFLQLAKIATYQIDILSNDQRLIE